MKESKSVPGVFLLAALAVCLSALTLIAQDQPVPLFDAAPEVSVSLFESSESSSVPSAQSAVELFETPMKSDHSPIELFDTPISAEISGALSREKLVYADLLVEVAAEQPDTRPIIEAYSIDGCKPCVKNKEAVGEGDARAKVRWHHSEKGDAHPWHIHNHALTQGYPVFHYPVAGGEWKRTSGTRSMDELAALVGAKNRRPVFQSGSEQAGMHCHKCDRCQTVWCHNPSNKANVSHNCPKCGQYQNVILQ